MSKYFSNDTVMAAFSLLNTKLSAGTHFSALQYMFALDNFVHAYGRDCDTSSDEDIFISFAHKVGRLEDGEVPDHVDGFTGKKPKKDKDSARIHSNFISAGAVIRSERATREDPELYPSGKSNYLFAISRKVLLADSVNYDHLDVYLPSKEMKTAFAVWVERNTELKDTLSFAEALKEALSQSYTVNLVNALWKDGAPSPDDIGLADGIFSNDKPRIDWAAIGERFPVDDLKNAPSEAILARSSAELPEKVAHLPRNWIFFGAPGTGKSYQLNEYAEENFAHENVRRVTFYPDYTYSQFVGGYRPSPLLDDEGKPLVDGNGRPTGAITYEFIPGPFIYTYVRAVQNPTVPYLLIIEEINRANPAAVFGDVFQLLDRNKDGRSVYEVAVPKEMEDYLRIHLPEYATDTHISEPTKLLSEQKRLGNEARRLSLPPNMYIWATMNSADQGVFPMDTAFKRRWDFCYMDINEGANADINGTKLSEIQVPCGKHTVKWDSLRMAINEFLMSDGLHINEDKLLGPFFVAPTSLTSENFTQAFTDKVLLYLFEDIGKTKRAKLFRTDLKTYSQARKAFEDEGAAIFGEGFPALEYCSDKKTDATNDDTDSRE